MSKELSNEFAKPERLGNTGNTYVSSMGWYPMKVYPATLGKNIFVLRCWIAPVTEVPRIVIAKFLGVNDFGEYIWDTPGNRWVAENMFFPYWMPLPLAPQ